MNTLAIVACVCKALSVEPCPSPPSIVFVSQDNINKRLAVPGMAGYFSASTPDKVYILDRYRNDVIGRNLRHIYAHEAGHMVRHRVITKNWSEMTDRERDIEHWYINRATSFCKRKG